MQKISPYIYPGCYHAKLPPYAGNQLKNITVNDILMLVCNRMKVSHNQLTARTRKRNIMDAKHILYYLCRQHTPHSIHKITSLIGTADHHTTFIHATDKIKSLLQNNQEIKTIVEVLQHKLEILNQQKQAA